MPSVSSGKRGCACARRRASSTRRRPNAPRLVDAHAAPLVYPHAARANLHSLLRVKGVGEGMCGIGEAGARVLMVEVLICLVVAHLRLLASCRGGVARAHAASSPRLWPCPSSLIHRIQRQRRRMALRVVASLSPRAYAICAIISLILIPSASLLWYITAFRIWPQYKRTRANCQVGVNMGRCRGWEVTARCGARELSCTSSACIRTWCGCVSWSSPI